MRSNVLAYLDSAAARYPDKAAYEDITGTLTFSQVQNDAERIGTALARQISKAKVPVVVFMDKSIKCIPAFLGVTASGNFYCPLDHKMPAERIRIILEVLEPAAILTDEQHLEQVSSLAGNCPVFLYETLVITKPDPVLLADIRKKSTELDPLYVLFTSGSTGVPKGVLLNHRVVINYLEWLAQDFVFDENDVFGNQAPFYFDVSVHDIYGALCFGAKMVIIPPELFGFPVKLIEYMNQMKISAFLWVPSAMGIIAALDAFCYAAPKYLKHIMFAGEVLQRKQLDYWRSYLPDAVYANLYGPTETFVCTAYIMDGNEADDRPLPIGIPIINTEALVLTDDNRPAAPGETGELCIRGSCLALGYYGNRERTNQSFIQNPLHNKYPDLVYRTGDLVQTDKKGNLIYLSRKDYQIKHMGYRIELGEIEAAAGRLSHIQECACIYDKSRILLFYTGKALNPKEILAQLEKRIPHYMLPAGIVHLAQLPHNANGKIDRMQLRNM